MLLSAVGLAGIKAYFQEKVLFGNKPSPELGAIVLIYFVQGILGLARLAVSFFLKDDLGLTPAETEALLGIAMLPWIVKPLFGFLSDGLPLFGYRRRPYLILAGLLGAFSWIAMATVVETAVAVAVAIALSSLSVAIADVIVDSIIVERVREESIGDAGSLQSLCFGTSAFGGLLTAYLSGWLLEQFNTRTLFAIVATFPLLVSVVAWIITESRTEARPNWSTVGRQVQQLRWAISRKVIWLPMAFMVFWQSTPRAESAFFFFTTNDLGFQPEFLGRVRLIASLATLLGIWIYQRFLRNVPLRAIFGWSTVLSALLGMTTLLLVTHANRALGIDDYWFSLGDSLILTVMGEIAFLPFMVLAARLCPPGIEATMFALLMSFWNLARLVSQELGALLTHLLGVTETNFDLLWLLVLVTNASTLLPLLGLHWVPATDPQVEVQAAFAEVSLSGQTGTDLEPSVTPLSESSAVSDLVPEDARS